MVTSRTTLRNRDKITVFLCATSSRCLVFWNLSEVTMTKWRHQYTCLMTKKMADGSKKRQVDSGAVECVTSTNRVPHFKVEETPESRRGDVDVRRRERNQEGRQSNNPLDDRIRCLEERCVQGWSSVSHADQCRQVKKKRGTM